MSSHNRPDDPGDSQEHGPEEMDESSPSRVFARHSVGEALSKAGFGDTLVLSHEAADRALTPPRRKIIQTLQTEEPESVRDLASMLDRDPGNVARDLKVLIAEDIADCINSGRAKQPRLKHDTIVTEPLTVAEDGVKDIPGVES